MTNTLKMLILADGNSIHTEKWMFGLSLRNEFDLYLLTMNPAGTRQGIKDNPRVKGIFEIFSETVSVHGGNYHYLKNIFKINNIIKKLKPDIISTVYLTSYGLIGALVKGDSILSHFMIGSDMMVTPYRNMFYRWVTKYALFRGDYFVCASESMTRNLVGLSPIASERILTQQYGVSNEIINYPRQNKVHDFVSNRAWVPNSNIPLLLKIFSMIDSNTSLIVIGDSGPLAESIKERMRSMPSVTHLGLLPYMENIDVVAKSRFYVSLTSSDGASLSLIEAMAVGAIPIVSGIEPNKEWIEDGVNGFVIDLNDLQGAVAKFKEALQLPQIMAERMQERNFEIIRQKGSLVTNMNRFADNILRIVKVNK